MTKIPSKKTSEQLFEAWAKRTAKALVKAGGNKGARFVRKRGTDPVVKAANEVFKAAARRKIN